MTAYNLFLLLPKGNDLRFNYQNYNSMTIERPKQLNIFIFSFRNTSFIMFKSWLRNIDHTGKRDIRTNHDYLDGLPKCMQKTSMLLPCDSVTPNTYIDKRKCANNKYHNDTFARSIDMVLTQSHINWRYLLMFSSLGYKIRFLWPF
jgi:hypothetical protein